MKRIVCLLITGLLLSNTPALLNNSSAQAMPPVKSTITLGPSTSPNAEIIFSHTKELIPLTGSEATFNSAVVAGLFAADESEELAEFCARNRKEIMDQLEKLELAIEALEKRFAEAMGRAGTRLSSPVFRNAFRRTWAEAVRRMTARGLSSALFGLNITLALWTLIQTMDELSENLIMADLASPPISMPEAEAKEWAERIGDTIAHVAMNINIGFVGESSYLYHLLEMQSDQRLCRSNPGHKPPRELPKQPNSGPRQPLGCGGTPTPGLFGSGFTNGTLDDTYNLGPGYENFNPRTDGDVMEVTTQVEPVPCLTR